MYAPALTQTANRNSRHSRASGNPAIIPNNSLTPSLIQQLMEPLSIGLRCERTTPKPLLIAIPLSNHNTVAKWLVIPRKRESSQTNTPRSGQNLGIDPLRGDLLINWIPAYAGMTSLGVIGQSGIKPIHVAYKNQIVSRRADFRFKAG